jgi:phospholipid/cholesterol/gamma-HCH transport system permease protein
MVVNEGDGQEEAALTPDGQAGAPSYALTLSGDWTMERLGELALQIPDDAARAGARVVLDGSGIGRLDTAGGWVIERARRQAVAAGTQVELRHFSPMAASLLGVLAELAQSDLPPPPPAGAWTRRALVEIGKGAAILLDDGYAVLVMMGETVSALLAVLFGRRRMRWPALFSHINRTAIQAVPIIALMSFLIGMIIAQQGGFYLHTYGADVLVVDLVGVLTCREIGVLLTAIMVAGRSGSAFTAEIGSMKMREEIDAMQVLGLTPVDVLVLPRLMALALALPILTLVSDLAAVAGSWVIGVFYIGIPTDVFLTRLHAALTLTHVMIGFTKAPFMAAIIGLVACVEGMKVKGSAESLGEHTTASVVKAIFMVVVTDGVFAIAFATLGI